MRTTILALQIVALLALSIKVNYNNILICRFRAATRNILHNEIVRGGARCSGGGESNGLTTTILDLIAQTSKTRQIQADTPEHPATNHPPVVNVMNFITMRATR